ncbi:hypothetical protein CEB3_c38100 [Peptococcaceae bacterium CEB3]|nr:hypothetical protein CEB3_c38100 [Peptococcaceae bacterium CEB3]
MLKYYGWMDVKKMPRLSDCINLSNEIKWVPIPDLIVKAKSLITAKRYSQSTIWHYNERFNDLQYSAALFNTEKLSERFITDFSAETP